MANDRVVQALEELATGFVGLTAVVLAEGGGSAGQLTVPQWRALVVVARADGLRIGEVARRVGLGLPAASRLVRRLERRRLVTTERDERDRRATIVRPTPAGLASWNAVAERRRRRIATLLDDLAEPLRADLAGGLEQLAALFSQFPGAAAHVAEEEAG